jgi:glucose/mannose transport system permease protein
MSGQTWTGGKRKTAPRILLYVVIAVFFVFYLTPLYVTIATALKAPADISLATTWQFPGRPHWQSFAEAFGTLRIYFQNSIILAVVATVLSAVIGAVNGYIFSKWKFRGSELIFTLFLVGMFLPYQIILIPLFQTLKALGLYGGIPGLIVAHVVYGIPITTLIFRNYYAQIPNDIVDCGKVDGAGFYKIFGRIMLPLSMPGFVVVGIWQFTQIWNEFLWGITLTQKQANPITVGLAQLAGGQAVTWNLPMAGSIIAAAPVVLIYIFLGRYFIRGLLGGSIKG